MRECCAWYASIRCLRSSIALTSARVQRSKVAARGARNSSTAIHRLAISTSTATNWPNIVASTPKTSFMAAWLAPPPIQLPATVAMPRHVSPATVSGWMKPIAVNARQRTEHHAGRTGQEHHHRLRPQAHDGAEIHRHAQQHQRAGQQVIARHRVQPGRGAVDQADAVEHRRDQITQQQRRHEAVELLPEAVLARRAPEHGAQHDGQQAEYHGVVGDQGGVAVCMGGRSGGSGTWGLESGRADATTAARDVYRSSRRHRQGRSVQGPMCFFSQACTVSCHSRLLCGLSTQWFSSGKYSSCESMPLALQRGEGGQALVDRHAEVLLPGHDQHRHLPLVHMARRIELLVVLRRVRTRCRRIPTP